MASPRYKLLSTRKVREDIGEGYILIAKNIKLCAEHNIISNAAAVELASMASELYNKFKTSIKS